VYLVDETPPEPQPLYDRLVNLGARTPAAATAAQYPMPAAAAIERELIVIQPGNHRSMGPRRARWRRLNTDDKWWPLERWAQLFHRIHECRKDALLVLRGSPEEVPMLEEIRAAAALENVVVVGHGLRELFALCEAAHSMISVDTGPAHAAAALSVPLVVLYGAETARYWLPRSPSGSPVVAVGGPPYSTRADQVSVDTVFEAWRSLEPRVQTARVAD
jgi:heptosyltransferase-2/heptosyltransferase-3